jgi:hypothetical protein
MRAALMLAGPSAALVIALAVAGLIRLNPTM